MSNCDSDYTGVGVHIPPETSDGFEVAALEELACDGCGIKGVKLRVRTDGLQPECPRCLNCIDAERLDGSHKFELHDYAPAIMTADGGGVAFSSISSVLREQWENLLEAEVLAKETPMEYFRFDTRLPGRCLGLVPGFP